MKTQTTPAEFQSKLIALQNEQKTLLSSTERRKKSVRARIQEITKEFYAIKKEWRNAEA